jgi:hypothetical protein
LAEIASHNFSVLGAENVAVSIGNGLELLPVIQKECGRIDWIYLDPSRRKKDRTRVFRLEEYEPNVPGVLPELFKVAPNVLLKTSPLLDLKEGARKLSHVREVHVVAVRNEVRELLWWLQEGYEGQADRIAVDLHYHGSPLRFSPEAEERAPVAQSQPLKYLYEPNAAILKAGGFKIAGAAYGLFKLHPLTHLYTSEKLLPFPGRRFEISQILPYKPRKLPFAKANESTRNFPETVARIRKRNRIRDGGDTFLFFVRTADESLKVLVGKPVVG